MNERMLQWLEEAEEWATEVEVVEEYVNMTAEQEVELERIERQEWAEFWETWGEVLKGVEVVHVRYVVTEAGEWVEEGPNE